MLPYDESLFPLLDNHGSYCTYLEFLSQLDVYDLCFFYVRHTKKNKL